MATIPAGTRFIGISTTADLGERKSTIQNSLTEPYTIEDLIDGVDFTVINATTSALSKATLNSTYAVANFPIGTKVVCRDITGGGLTYLRVASADWVSFAVTTVS
jgi:hypothetical protein